MRSNKHILRAAEFLKDLVLRDVIRLEHLSGSAMVADLLTKAVSRVMFRALIQLLREYSVHGIVCPPSVASSASRPGGTVADHTAPPSTSSARE